MPRGPIPGPRSSIKEPFKHSSTSVTIVPPVAPTTNHKTAVHKPAIIMAFGTLYTHNPNPRSTAILAVAKANGLDLDIIYAEKSNPEAYAKLLKLNPTGQVPVFVGADGYVLTECIPISLYITSQKDTSTLLGSSRRDYYNILRWMSFANSDLLPAIGGILLPLIGRRQIIAQDKEDSLLAFRARCKLLNEHLKLRRFLVGGQVSLADFFVVGILAGAYMGFRGVMEAEFPDLTRWFDEVYGIPLFSEVAGELP
ncbi:hypothetical protein BBP40_011658, partial [Aspergillus hancockii]